MRQGRPPRRPGPGPDQRQHVCAVRRLAGRLHLQDRQDVLSQRLPGVQGIIIAALINCRSQPVV